MSVDEQRMSQNFQDNSLTISGTIVRDSGVYTCIISNGLDEARAYAFVTVKGNISQHTRFWYLSQLTREGSVPAFTHKV